MQFKEISIKAVVVLENHRLQMDKGELNSLAASIKQVGLRQPIEVYAPIRGKYELLSGHRRLKACLQIGLKKIQCLIKPRPKDKPGGNEAKKHMLIVNITENMQRVNPSFPEFGRAIEQLHEVCGMTLTDIGRQLGKEETVIRALYQTWTKLPKKHRSIVKFMDKRGRTGGGVGANVAHNILRLKRSHGLSEKHTDLLFKRVNKQKMSKDNIETVGALLKDGMPFEQAMNAMGNYKSFYVEIVADPAQVEDFRRELELPNTGLVLKRILYGECPPLSKPKFVTT